MYIHNYGAAILTAFVLKTEYQLLLQCRETVPGKVENKCSLWLWMVMVGRPATRYLQQAPDGQGQAIFIFINKTLIPVLLNLKDEAPLEITKIH